MGTVPSSGLQPLIGTAPGSGLDPSRHKRCHHHWLSVQRLVAQGQFWHSLSRDRRLIRTGLVAALGQVLAWMVLPLCLIFGITDRANAPVPLMPFVLLHADGKRWAPVLATSVASFWGYLSRPLGSLLVVSVGHSPTTSTSALNGCITRGTATHRPFRYGIGGQLPTVTVISGRLAALTVLSALCTRCFTPRGTATLLCLEAFTLSRAPLVQQGVELC